MTKRMIDRNAHRFGAAISMVILLTGFALDYRAIVPVMAGVLAVGPILGLRHSPLGVAYRAVKRALNLSIPFVPEEEAPPRFAQLLGFVFLGIGTLGFYAWSSDGVGWTFALIVAALQGLLATTGICVGCEVYLLGRRLGAGGAA